MIMTNTTNLFYHLRQYHTAESCTDLILKTRLYTPYLTASDPFSNSSTNYISHPEPTRYKLLPTADPQPKEK